MDLKGKRLLILAGADVHCKVVKAAHDLGVYTIVTDYLPIDESPAKQIADEAWQLNIMDVDLIVERCRSEKVDGVLAFCIDPAQIPYQKICEKLGVPCYGTRDQFEIMTNKRKFKDFCKEVGVDCIPEYTLEDVAQDRVVYPVLVKPSDSRGSRGQTVCYSKDKIDRAVEIAKRESSDNVALIERCMFGKQDFSLAYIVIDSIPYLLKIGDRFLGTKKDNLERQHICTLLPSLSADGYKEKVEPRVFRLIHALDIKFGAVFLQGFVENDHVYFYDPGLRFPGGDFDVVLEHATGFSSMSSMVKFALTGDVTSCTGNPEDAYELNGGTCMILSIAVRPGKIGTFEGLDLIAKDPHVFSVGQRYHVGEVVPDTGDLKQRAAELVAYFDSRDAAKDFCNKVYHTVHIRDENGMDMIVSKMGEDIPFENIETIKASV